MSAMDALPPAGGTVRDAFYQLMRDAGCRVMFGNPGSTELPMFRGFPGDMG